MRDLDRRRHGRELGRRSSTRRRCSTPARSTARSTACRSTSTPGSGSGSPTRPSRTPACRCRPTGTSSSPPAPALREGRQSPLAIGRAGLAADRAFNVPDAGARRQGPLPARSTRTRTPRSPAGPEMAKVFKAADDARKMAKGSNVQDWNQATNMVITGQAGGQIMGDWAQGEFQVAGQVAGKDYTCLPGLGVHDAYITTGGDAFYFPLLDDAETVEGAGGARLGDDVARDAGRLQPQEGLAAGARRRRPRRRQRLHEEGPRDPRRRATSSPSTDELISPDTNDPAQRPDDAVLQRHEHDARGRAGALRRDHRQRRLTRRPRPRRPARAGGPVPTRPSGGKPHGRAASDQASCSTTSAPRSPRSR